MNKYAIGIGLSLLFAGAVFVAGTQKTLAEEPPVTVTPLVDAPAIDTARLRVPKDGFRRVVTYGDSIAHGIGRYVRSDKAGGLPVADYAIPGAGLRSPGVVASLNKIQPGDLVIVSVGTNDLVTMLADPAYTMHGYARQVRDLLRNIRAKGAEPILLGLNAENYDAHYERYGITDEQWNTELMRLSAELQAMAAEEKVVFSERAPGGVRSDGSYVATAGDGLHYSNSGYVQVYANALRDARLDLMPVKPVPAPAP